MLDYALLEALAAVVREGSFERAAQALHLTPSAVSQRVKLLEQRLGQVLVVRAQPCTATAAGLKLCRHVQTVGLLEHELHAALPALGAAGVVTLRVAVNADSLATWFVPAAAAFSASISAPGGALLDLSIDDEAHTADRLKSADVIAAVTTLAAAVQGCRSLALGHLRYLACASPAFVQRHFACGVTAATLATAPCLTFNQKDRLQDQWIERRCGMLLAPPRHWLPSTHAFAEAGVAGLGWGLHPELLVRPLLDRGALVPLVPGDDFQVPLHWQHARAASPLLQRLSDAVLAASERLRS